MEWSNLSCFERCRQLHDAYLDMLAGRQKVEVRHSDYWVEYRANNAGDMDRLLKLYGILRDGCAEAQAKLPDLNPRSANRGPAIPWRA